MVKCKLSNHLLTDEELRKAINLFKDPLATQGFIDLLMAVRSKQTSEQSKASNAYLLSDDPAYRALALKHYGKIEFIDDLIRFLQMTNKA